MEVQIISGEDDGLAQVEAFFKHTGSTGEVWLTLLETTGNIGSSVNPQGGVVNADKIGTLRTTEGGSLTALVEATGSTIDDDVDIELIDISGNLWNHVNAASGQIGNITVDGNIGDPTFGDPMFPNTVVVEINSPRNIGIIEASAIYAEISSKGDNGSGNGTIDSVVTSAGDFVGSLLTHGFDVFGANRAMSIAGDLDADVTVNSLPLENDIRIDGSLASGRTIYFTQPSTIDEVGQIYINRGNNGGSLDGTIQIGTSSPIVITDPDYAATATSIGGGSIGEAPFYLHETSCNPPDNSSFAGIIADPSSILFPPACMSNPYKVGLRFYGPVQLLNNPPQDEIIMVEKYNDYTLGWDDVTEDFKVTTTGDPRTLLVWPVAGDDEWELGIYRMTPFVDDTENINIQSANVENVPFVRNFSYIVTVEDACEEFMLMTFDMNDDDDLTYAGDVHAWLVSPTNFTADEVADEEDLEALLNAIGRFNE